MSSVSLLLKLLLSVLKRFIPALLHLLLSPSSINLKVIKILLTAYTAYCSHSKTSHWFLWPLGEVWNEWERKKKVELMVYSREKIIDEGGAITKMKSPDLCPVMTQEWQRLSKLIRVYTGLRYVKAVCSFLKGKPSQHGNDLYKEERLSQQAVNEWIINYSVLGGNYNTLKKQACLGNGAVRKAALKKTAIFIWQICQGNTEPAS